MIGLSFFLVGIVGVFCVVKHDGCYPSPYRSYDGTCNNVRHPLWGSAFSPYLHTSHDRKSDKNFPNSAKIVETLNTLNKPLHHDHITGILGLWADLISRDLSQPILMPEGLLNGATGYLDASSIYGVADEQVDRIKSHHGYININACDLCQSGSGIGVLYSLFYKEHNRIVDELTKLNRAWPEDILFEETRKIVSAQIQHITFNEFLPIVLQENDWGLPLKTRGFHNDYSSSVEAGTIYEAAITSLNVIPSVVPPNLSITNETGTLSDSGFVGILQSSFLTPAKMPNLNFNKFRGYPSASQILDQSRHNQAASYIEQVKECTGEYISDFSQILFVSEENRKLLSTLYSDVSQIDLLIGGMLESPLHGALVGPTFACLLSKQFNLLKVHDRFWYENDLPPATFSSEQLTELRKVTLGGLICQNIKSLPSIQPKVFLQEDPFLNAGVSCDHHSKMDLIAWKNVENRIDEQGPLLTMDLVKQALKKAEEDVARRQRQEYVVYVNHGTVDPKSPIGTAAAFSKPNRMALTMANNSVLFEYASQELMAFMVAKQRRRRQLDGDNVIGFDLSVKDVFSDLDITDLFPPSIRHEEPECHEENGPCDPRSPYRSFTGQCNNLERPRLGRSLTTFARLLPSVYENGISSPRSTSVTGAPLPSARLVSSMIHADISYLHKRYTLMLMQFAQFVDHDITFTPSHRGFFASIPDCRSCDSALTVHPECMPIPVPIGDPFFPQRNISTGERFCLSFMRSLPGQQQLGPREQINQNSAYLDASQVYGENSCLARELRGYGGRLNVTTHPTRGKDLLPVSPIHPECKAPSGYCFIAGDGRASEQPGLTSIHTVYMREHNRLVEGLRKINLHWGDEKLYQTARKIAIASYQHVLYNEFLPRLLGWNAINLYGLKLQNHGYYKGYSRTCNPNIVTEFASAAYRIGHSLLRPHMPRMSPAFTPVEPSILLRNTFFNPDIIYQPHMIDEIMRGLSATPMESLDQFITGEISNHLFEDRRIPHSGMDLPALNIQRARDHGIPPYNEYRSLCNLKRATSWEDLSREIPMEVIKRLKVIYPTVNDIDLFPGGLSERPLQGGLVGPTFACIIGLQFRQLRKCDRFWYENEDAVVRFTEAQLAEIRKTTLSKVVCDNLDVPSEIQRSVFDQPSDFLNPRVSCHSLPSIDLKAWRETVQKGCQIAGRSVPVGESAIPTPCTSCICTSEGPQCASLRVTDCGRLLREAGQDAVLRDEVCASQCSPFLTDTVTVSLTTRRPRTRVRDFIPAGLLPPPLQVKRRPSLRSFISEFPHF
ncbi:uncharacterized protein LOC106670552 [Cimex lectularius]|uniref:Uncharacterized protein n=1 Tax=Cimex lectularius TaxID=79782 RepID=A0A8I6S5E8_CIMLE|nr:uncharacterized protein LOC106670552 [Cimex lectularius]